MAVIITPRIRVGGVIVDRSVGEFLTFKITASGGTPIFTFACRDNDRLSADDFSGHPKQVYEWEWGKKSTDLDREDDTYATGFMFTHAVKYTLLVNHRNRNGGVIQVITDIDIESDNSQDSHFEDMDIVRG